MSTAYADLVALVKSAHARQRMANPAKRMTITIEFVDGRLVTANFAEELRVGRELQRSDLESSVAGPR